MKYIQLGDQKDYESNKRIQTTLTDSSKKIIGSLNFIQHIKKQDKNIESHQR